MTLLRRRWLFIAIVVLLGGGAAAAVGVTLAPKFTAKAQLLYQMEVLDGTEQTDEAAVDTLVEMLLSPSHVRRLALSLQEDPGSIDQQPSAEATAPANIFRQEVGTTPLILDYATLDEGLNVFKERQSRLVAVTFRSVDPQISALVANRAVELYLDTEAEFQRERRTRALSAVSDRMPDALARIDEAEGALREHRINHGLSDANGADQTDRQISELSRQSMIARADLAARDAQIDSLRSLRLGAMRTAPTEVEGYEKVAARNGDTALPDTSAPLAQTTGSDLSIDQLTRDRAAVAARLGDIEQRLSSLQKASTKTTAAWIRLRELEREANAAGQAYENLLHRKADILGQGIARPAVRLVTTAEVPDRPSSPNPLLFVAPAIIAAFLVAGMLAVLFERLDQRLRSERDVEESLGAPCIGLVPRLARRYRAALPDYLRKHPYAPYTEAIRSVFVAATRQSAQTFLVTSSDREAGKSTLILSLAAYAARLRRRVLVIDLDLRNPHLMELLEDPAQKETTEIAFHDEQPSTERPWGISIRTSEKFGIDYLTVPQQQIDPLTILSHEDFPALLKQLRRIYDCILIDSAPVVEATETRLLAAMVDRVLFTVRWGVTEAGDALAAVQQLRASDPAQGIPISVVVNQVKLGAHRRGHYSEAVPMPSEQVRA